MHRRAFLGTALTAAVFVTALHGPAAAEDWKSKVDTIRFGILSSENEKDHTQRYSAFKDYLEKNLGVEIETYTASSYDGVIQALAADQIEFAFLGSSAYAAAWTETDGGVEPLVSRLQDDGSTGYYSVVAVRCDSPYKSVDDLQGKTLAFADPDSTSGYAVPYFNLLKQGYNPETYFGATPFSGSHETGVLGVVNGQFDAAATYITNDIAGIPQRMVEKGMIKAGEVCWIWTSPEITSGPLTARKNLPDDLKRTMQKLVMEVPQKDPEAFAQMTGNPKQVGWIEVDHDRYAWIVEMREEIRKIRRNRGS
ncbi:phosphonate ABC transporter substrate-binding protein [Pelagibius sp. 7325]|uniref:phosphonate ABC transporter substrate-binding protein n=1 Tax=Pelagibius sp. 7325 TaxID=3131994 RepID=UPI0030EBB32E